MGAVRAAFLTIRPNSGTTRPLSGPQGGRLFVVREKDRLVEGARNREKEILGLTDSES